MLLALMLALFASAAGLVAGDRFQTWLVSNQVGLTLGKLFFRSFATCDLPFIAIGAVALDGKYRVSLLATIPIALLIRWAWLRAELGNETELRGPGMGLIFARVVLVVIVFTLPGMGLAHPVFHKLSRSVYSKVLR